jgi:hypothetical protein
MKNKTAFGLLAAVLTAALALPAAGAVVKKTKSEIAFKGFGRLTSVQTEWVTQTHRRSDMTNDFKGKGLLGGLAGKAMLRSGDMGEIVDLPAMTMTAIDHKRKEYTVSPIEPLDMEEASAAARPGAPGGAEDSDIKITRNEFTVNDTGRTSIINGFETRQYVILWVMDWENVKTGEKGGTRLETESWNTPMSGALAEAQAVEAAFFEAHLKAMGLDADKLQQDILGSSWLDIFQSLSMKPQPGAQRDVTRFEKEMAKIQGYPVLIDGRYFDTSPKPEARPQEEERGVGGMLGGLAKKALKKKAPADEEEEPSLSYRIELLELKPADLGPQDFQAPAGYKKKG